LFDQALRFLEVVERVRALIESRGIKEQTFWLALGLLAVVFLFVAVFRRFAAMLSRSMETTAKVADERDQLEEIIFEKRGSKRLSSKDYEVNQITWTRLIVRTFRKREGDKSGRKEGDGK
jgi:hypothetical protein